MLLQKKRDGGVPIFAYFYRSLHVYKGACRSRYPRQKSFKKCHWETHSCELSQRLLLSCCNFAPHDNYFKPRPLTKKLSADVQAIMSSTPLIIILIICLVVLFSPPLVALVCFGIAKKFDLNNFWLKLGQQHMHFKPLPAKSLESNL